jgi:hypothetical protein
VTPNYHTLSDFRVGHGAKLDALLTQILAALMSVGVLRLQRVAQDGVRVRAHAGAGAARERAARERAVRERETQLRRALAELPKVQAVRDQNAKREGKARREQRRDPEVRVSTTDPEARIMRMADGGYRPAMNLQFASDTETRLIVGVDASNAGTDRGQLTPMLDQIVERTSGTLPAEYLVDGGYAQLLARRAPPRDREFPLVRISDSGFPLARSAMPQPPELRSFVR